MKGRANIYSADELAWIEAHKHVSRRELHAAFCAKFDRQDIQFGALQGLCKRNGWFTGRNGRFEKGQESWNKGKPMPSHPNSVKTQFQPGVRQGVAAKLYQLIGTERVSRDGYLERKVNDDMPLQQRWRAVHLIRWEEANGPVPEGHCLKCLDGDRTNTDPENWACIPRALLPRLAGRWQVGYDDAPAELKPILLRIAQLEHAAREAKKGRQV